MKTADFNIKEFLKVARDTKAFSSDECLVLEEVLIMCNGGSSKDYILLKEERNGELAGFIIFGPIPMTDFAWDLYWIVVNPDFQRQGIGKELLKRMEKTLLSSNNKAVIRVETSSKSGYSGQRQFYSATGYTEIGRILDFYGEGDDLVIYTKKIKTGS